MHKQSGQHKIQSPKDEQTTPVSSLHTSEVSESSNDTESEDEVSEYEQDDEDDSEDDEENEEEDHDETLESPKILSTENKHQYPKCHQIYTKCDKLKRHMAGHKDPEKTSYICKNCSPTCGFKTRQGLTGHKITGQHRTNSSQDHETKKETTVEEQESPANNNSNNSENSQSSEQDAESVASEDQKLVQTPVTQSDDEQDAPQAEAEIEEQETPASRNSQANTESDILAEQPVDLADIFTSEQNWNLGNLVGFHYNRNYAGQQTMHTRNAQSIENTFFGDMQHAIGSVQLPDDGDLAAQPASAFVVGAPKSPEPEDHAEEQIIAEHQDTPEESGVRTRTLRCPECSDTFPKSATLFTHLAEHLYDTESGEYYNAGCFVCEEYFDSDFETFFAHIFASQDCLNKCIAQCKKQYYSAHFQEPEAVQLDTEKQNSETPEVKPQKSSEIVVPLLLRSSSPASESLGDLD